MTSPASITAESGFASPLAFTLIELTLKKAAARELLLGEPDLVSPGDGEDEETGIRYDEERSYTVEDYTIDLLLRDGETRQVTLTTGFDDRLRGIEAVRACLAAEESARTGEVVKIEG